MPSRTEIIRGPAIVTLKTGIFYTEDDITLDPEITTFKTPSSIYGESDERLDNIVFNLSFKPESFWDTSKFNVLYPYSSPVYGSSVFGATDSDVTIQTLAGQEIKLCAGAVTAMPELTLGANKSMFGSVTMTCIGKQDTAWNDAAKRAVITAKSFADTTYNSSDIITVPYTGTWGSTAPWDSIDSADGWTISFDVAMDDVTSDSYGIIDKTLGTVGVMAKCTPIGVSEANLLSLLRIQGAGVARGASLSSNANDLVIQGSTAGDPKVTIFNAAPKTAGFRFGQTVLRAGEVGWTGVAKIVSSAPSALFELSSVPA